MTDSLNDLFPSTSADKTYRVQDARRKMVCGKYNIYPLSQFTQLLDDVQAINSAKKHAFRFLIDRNNQLWFAPEGTSNKRVPAHYQLTGQKFSEARCKAAGMIFINKNTGGKGEDDGRAVLRAINHKSGDFRPDFESLRRLLVILANTPELPFKIEQSFILKKLDCSGGVLQEYVIEDQDLEHLKLEGPDLDSLGKQPTEIKKVTYKPTIHRTAAPVSGQSSFFASSTARSLFANEAASPARNPLFDDVRMNVLPSSNTVPATLLFDNPPSSPQKRSAAAEDTLETPAPETKKSRFS